MSHELFDTLSQHPETTRAVSLLRPTLLYIRVFMDGKAVGYRVGIAVDPMARLARVLARDLDAGFYFFFLLLLRVVIQLGTCTLLHEFMNWMKNESCFGILDS